MNVTMLDRSWRLCGTGIAFAVLFGGGLLLTVTAFPVVRILVADEDERGRRIRLLISRLFRLYVGMLRWLRIIDLEIEGLEKTHERTGCVIIANHPTLLDVVILTSLFADIRCVVKEELLRSRWLGGVVRAAGYISNDLDADALLRACRSSLTRGSGLIVFPEGTRSRPGEPMRFRRGFANIAIMLGSDVQPIVIRCNPPTLMKGEKWWMIPDRRPMFRISIGDRLDIAERFRYDLRPIAARKLVRTLEEYYAHRLAHG